MDDWGQVLKQAKHQRMIWIPAKPYNNALRLEHVTTMGWSYHYLPEFYDQPERIEFMENGVRVNLGRILVEYLEKNSGRLLMPYFHKEDRTHPFIFEPGAKEVRTMIEIFELSR